MGGKYLLTKFLLIRPKIGFGIGGAEYHAAQVAVKLLEWGHKVSLLAHTISFPEDILKNLETYHVKFKGFGSVLKQLLFVKQAKNILTSLKEPYKIISFFVFPLKQTFLSFAILL